MPEVGTREKAENSASRQEAKAAKGPGFWTLVTLLALAIACGLYVWAPPMQSEFRRLHQDFPIDTILLFNWLIYLPKLLIFFLVLVAASWAYRARRMCKIVAIAAVVQSLLGTAATIAASVHLARATKAYDIAVLDRCLNALDKALQDGTEPSPLVTSDIEHHLSRALMDNHPGAPARYVFFAITDPKQRLSAWLSPTCTFRQRLASNIPIRALPDDQSPNDLHPGIILPSDVYQWWLKNRQSYQSFALLDDWLARETTKKTILPQYEKQAQEDDRR